MTNEQQTTQPAGGCCLQRLVRRVRSFVIWHTAGLMNLTGKIHYADTTREIGWLDHLRWWLEGMLGVVFGWAWDGSDEEIAAVVNSEVPLEYMSPRQRAVLTLPRSEYGAHCCHCGWVGWWTECKGDHDCPGCGKGVYLDVPNRYWTVWADMDSGTWADSVIGPNGNRNDGGWVDDRLCWGGLPPLARSPAPAVCMNSMDDSWRVRYGIYCPDDKPGHREKQP